MKSLSQIAGIVLISLLGLPEECQAQITDSDQSAQMIASRIAADSGRPAANYLNYGRSLAKTLSLLSNDQQARVFDGAIPTPGGPGGPPTGTGNYPDANAAIQDGSLSSLDLLGELLALIPLSTADLDAVLNRVPAMDSEDLKDLLIGQGNLSQGFLISNMQKSNPVLSSTDLKDVLIDNSPLSAVALAKVAGSANLTAADKVAVLAANGGVSGPGLGKGKK